MNRSRGFTLIELLTVIAIIAILSAIIVPAIVRAKDSAARSSDMSDLNALRTALQQYRVDQGGYPPALLGYVTLYSSGPNMGQVIPANLLQGFLYSRRIDSLDTFRPTRNRSGFADTTTARWPGTEANASTCAAQAFDANNAGLVANTALTNGDPTPVNNPALALQFYRVSGYDVTETVGPDQSKRFELRYTLFWTNYGLGANGCPLGSGADNTRQLGYEDPPDTTVVTWNSTYRNTVQAPPARQRDDIVLYLGGGARPVDSAEMFNKAWAVNP